MEVEEMEVEEMEVEEMEVEHHLEEEEMEVEEMEEEHHLEVEEMEVEEMDRSRPGGGGNGQSPFGSGAPPPGAPPVSYPESEAIRMNNIIYGKDLEAKKKELSNNIVGVMNFLNAGYQVTTHEDIYNHINMNVKVTGSIKLNSPQYVIIELLK